MTGGFEFGATSTRSRSAAWALRSASWVSTMPSCSPSSRIWLEGLTRRKSYRHHLWLARTGLLFALVVAAGALLAIAQIVLCALVIRRR